MNKTYVIEWKSKSNGRMGRGTTLFDRQEAEALAEELNRDYPEIEHLPVKVDEAHQPQEMFSLPG